MKKIGFIGLGVMGARMARRLLQSEFHLAVYDIDKTPMRALSKAGAATCKSVAEVAGVSDCLISMLPSPSVTRDVIIGPSGAITGLRPGALFIDTSTSDPMLTREIAWRLKTKRVGMLDAPVSGGMKAAEDGSLTFMVGGGKSALRKVEPILKRMGKAIHHVGPVGSAHTLKLINNMLFTIIMAAMQDPGFLNVVKNQTLEVSYKNPADLSKEILELNALFGNLIKLGLGKDQ